MLFIGSGISFIIWIFHNVAKNLSGLDNPKRAERMKMERKQETCVCFFPQTLNPTLGNKLTDYSTSVYITKKLVSLAQNKCCANS